MTRATAASMVLVVGVTWAFCAAMLSQHPISVGSLPSSNVTPGALNPAVTQANIDTTICVPGWTKSVRPAAYYTNRMKHQQLVQWGYTNLDPRDYEEDHLVPLELGGAPLSPLNLWPEPRVSPDGWGAAKKDRLEGVLHGLVCAHNISLSSAQEAIMSNWIVAYARYVQPAQGATP